MSIVRFFAKDRFNTIDYAGYAAFVQLMFAGQPGKAFSVWGAAFLVSTIAEIVSREKAA